MPLSAFFPPFFFIKERFGCPGLFTTMVLVGTGVGIMECITGGGADGIWVGGGLGPDQAQMETRTKSHLALAPKFPLLRDDRQIFHHHKTLP